MKVIYIHQYFKTPEEGGAIRSYHLARGLVEAGIEVEMITAHNQKHYDIRMVEGIKVHYLPVDYQHEYGAVRRSLSFFYFVIKAKKLLKKINRPDLLYITSTPLTVGLLGLWVKRKMALPYIFEVRDLWPEAPIQVGVIKNKWLQRRLYHLEEKIYRHALRIVALSPGIKNHILSNNPALQVTLISNFSDTQFFTPAKKDISATERMGLKDRFTIAYTGALGRVNALDDFIYLAKEALDQTKDWQFVVMGKGAKEQELKQLAERLELANVCFFPFGDKMQVRKVLEASDMAYISFDQLPVLRTNSPNKFFDALAMGKAILTNQKGWICNLVEDNQLGLFHSIGNHSKTIRKLEKFAENPQLLQQAQERSRKLAVAHFSKEKAIGMLLFTLDPLRFKIDPSDGVCIQTA